MKRLKRIAEKLVFPHNAVLLVLLPISAVLLIYSMVFVGTESVIAYISYVLSAYTLSVWCVKIPRIWRFFCRIRRENRYARRWLEDARLRVNISLYGSLIFNTVYAVFQLALGIYHSSFWYGSLAAYYLSLAVMRFFLLRHTRLFAPGERMRAELSKYRSCGRMLLAMNIAISLMVFFMVYWNRSFEHHEITTIAMAAYTFTVFTLAVIGMVKYRKFNSPVYSAAKAVSLASACVSLLTLESTMLGTFGGGESMQFRRVMLAVSGGAVSAFIILMAVYMIVRGTKKLKEQINE